MTSLTDTAKPRMPIMDVIVLTLICGIFYLLWLGHYPLFTPDEGRYSEVAREMIVTHDFLTPHLNGIPFLDKPILHYWLQVLALKAFGMTEQAVRFFPALFGIMGCVMVYFFGYQLFNRRTALLSASILATTPLYFGSAHYANLDLEVAVLISGCLLCWITAITTHHARYYYASTLFASLACLAKGLIGMVLPLMIGISWMILLRQWKSPHNTLLLKNMLLFLLVVLPWYIGVQHANPHFFQHFFIEQHVLRFLSGASFNNPMPGWFYLPIVLFGFLPWSFFLLPTMRELWKQSAMPAASIQLFLLIWIGIVMVFFSIPHSKIITYCLPVFPALALLVGHYLSTTFNRTKWLWMGLIIGNICLLLTVVWHAVWFNNRTIKPLLMTTQPTFNRTVEIFNYFTFYYDAPFYLERPMKLVANWHDPHIIQKDNWVREFTLNAAYQPNPPELITENVFWRYFNSPQPALVLLEEKYLDQFKEHAKHYRVLGRYRETLLIANRASPDQSLP